MATRSALCGALCLWGVSAHPTGTALQDPPQQPQHAVHAMGPQPDPWPSFRGGECNTARAAGPRRAAARSWTFTPDPPDVGGFYASPSIGPDGTVYIGSGSLYALDGTTGKKRWEFYMNNAGFYGSPAIDTRGRLYVECYNNNLYCIDSATGKMRWVYSLGDGGPLSPALGSDNALYVSGYDGQLTAIDTQTGKKRWSFRAPDQFESSPVVGRAGTVYFANGGTVYALDGASGKPVWKYVSDHKLTFSTPALDHEQTVYVALNFDVGDHKVKSRVVALDGATGQEKWKVALEDYSFSTPAVGDNHTLYIGCGDHALYAIDTRQGAVKWKFPTGEHIQASAAIGADGTVYIGSYDGKLYALNGETGAKKWEFEAGGGIQCSASVGANEVVYFGTLTNRFYALHNGKLDH